jgi:hypothetical protein
MIEPQLALDFADDLAAQLDHLPIEDRLTVALALLAKTVNALPKAQRDKAIDVLNFRLPRVVAGLVRTA